MLIKKYLKIMKKNGDTATTDPFGIIGLDSVVKMQADDETLKKLHFNPNLLKLNGDYPSPNSDEGSALSVAFKKTLFSRISSRRIRKRLVEKDGEYNITLVNVEKQKAKYFTDLFTTLIELKWRWLLVVFVCSFLGSWFLFALVYYGIMRVHDDFNPEKMTPGGPDPRCLTNTDNFLAVFMFSLETQHTIGYGSRYPSDKCPAILVALSMQSIFGLMMQTLLAGIVFAKLSRPHKRAHTLLFSRHACICMRDGRLCFLFRVGDMRKSHLAEAHVRVQLISKRVTNEGELLPFQQFDMDVGYSTGLDRIFVAWPITICHVIDEGSPLYQYSAADLSKARFEITVILEGVVQSGATMQARSSYLPSEILWGTRFEKLVTYKRDNGKYEIDFGKFDNVYEVDTPMLSAKEIEVLRRAGLDFENLYRCEDLYRVINSDTTPYDSIQKQETSRHPSIVRPADGSGASATEYKLLLPFDRSEGIASKAATSVYRSMSCACPPPPPSLESSPDGYLNADWSINGILQRHKHRRLSTHTRKLDELTHALSLEDPNLVQAQVPPCGPCKFCHRSSMINVSPKLSNARKSTIVDHDIM